MSTTTICVTDTSVIPFPTLESTTFTQASNTAASPLPHIPCRTVCPSALLTLSDSPLSDANAPHSSGGVDHPLQDHSASYVRHDSESSSSSSTPSDQIRPTIIPRSKRTPSQHSVAVTSRDMFTPTGPVSTPSKLLADGSSFADLESRKETPIRDPSDDEDTLRPFPALRRSPFCKVGKLRLEGSIGRETRHTPAPDVPHLSAPATGTQNVVKSLSQTIRKKSGQPVKSSLKSSRRPELHVVTDGPFAKSEPATPTKAVHFDSKLEHIKLFLAEQKPLAVSRNGSPTSDTSGDEFPSFIYGNAPRENQQVTMLVPNMPSCSGESDHVVLQKLVLSQDQRIITGSVRVRNIAYEKWLAARFTLDWWQTTSEVTARYDKSIEGGIFDVFTFTIRLSDIWSCIEKKTILIALRYMVAGREYWDNNAGQNYHVKFVLARPSEPSSAVDSETGLRDLNSRLEDVAKARSTPIPITPYRLGRSFSADNQYSSFTKPLSSRYDFAQAYRTRNAPTQPTRHTRTHTYPSGVPTTADPTVAPWSSTSKSHEPEQAVTPPPRSPSISLGSPRDAMDGSSAPSGRSETKPALTDSPSRERHHRRSYFDKGVEGSPTLRRTPAGSPLKFDVAGKDGTTYLPRIHSFPFTAPKPPLTIHTVPVGGADSEEPTPYTPSQTSSTNSSNSSSATLFSPVVGNDAGYKQFLDQFCFYTGADPLLQDASETLPRSHSTSSIEQYLLSHSPPQAFSIARSIPV